MVRTTWDEERISTIEERLARLERERAGAEVAPGAHDRRSRRTARESREPPARTQGRPVSSPAAHRPLAANGALPHRAPDPRGDAPPSRFDGDVRRSDRSLEDVLGGSVLAWVGAGATLLGIALLLAIAASRGWIGEVARTLMAGGASVGLLGLGAWLHERRGRTQAAVATAATGVAGAFATIAVAAQVHDLVPAPVAVLLALLTGTITTALAVRWDARGMAALGVLGALTAPAVAGTSAGSETLAVLLAAYAAAAVVLMLRRWEWLGLAAFGLVASWVVGHVLTGDATPSAAVAVVLAAALITATSAVGFDARVGGSGLRPVSALLLAANAVVTVAAGAYVAADGWSDDAAKGWVAAVALTHLLSGALLLRSTRASAALALVVLTLGVLIADIAAVVILDGLPLAAAWAASAAALAYLGGRGTSQEGAVAGAGVGLQLALAIAHVLAEDAPTHALADRANADLATAVPALASVIGACFASSAVASTRWRIALQWTGLAAFSYLTAITLDGAALVLAWAVQAAGLARVPDRDAVGRQAALGLLGLAAVHVLFVEAPPIALLQGVQDLDAAGVALGALALAAVLVAASVRRRPDAVPRRGVPEILLGSAALVALHLVSIAVVTLVADGQQAQMLVSVLWALVGASALTVGLAGDHRKLRLAALALLGAATAKLLLHDLRELESIMRVMSCIAVGLLLLAGGFAWQRMRPRNG